MLFSSFCWHYEDNSLYSISYNHLGCERTWYGVSGSQRLQFMEIAADHILDPSFAHNEGHLRLKTSLFSPGYALQHGIRVCKTIQRRGDFVITLPGAFHAGFSHGFSCTEAINFALPDWFPWGKSEIKAYARVARFPVIAYDELVIQCVDEAMKRGSKRRRRDDVFILEALKSIISEEISCRSAAFPFVQQVLKDSEDLIDHCAQCHQALCLSYFVCGCKLTSRFCLDHIHEHIGCARANYRGIHVFLRYSSCELKQRYSDLKKMLENGRPAENAGRLRI